MNERTNYSIVQIQADKFAKGEHAWFEKLEDMVPDHSDWESLTKELPPEVRTKAQYNIELNSRANAEFLEDAMGLTFISVGDWSCGYLSFSEHERDMVGIQEVVENDLPQIVKDIRAIFDKAIKEPWGTKSPSISIMTLWEQRTWQNSFDFEWDTDTNYVGVFDMANLAGIAKCS